MARPRVDNYPFTTLVPNLGVMTLDDERSLVIADVPGLIHGASIGRGLGHRFLRHIERTKILLHLLDITYQPVKDILEDFNILRDEIVRYNQELAQKPQMVVINKMDLYDPDRRDLTRLRTTLEEFGVDSLAISALSGDGIEELKKVIFEKCIRYGIFSP